MQGAQLEDAYLIYELLFKQDVNRDVRFAVENF